MSAPLTRTPSGATELAGRCEILPDRTGVRVNRIRYPRPNTLGLTRPPLLVGEHSTVELRRN